MDTPEPRGNTETQDRLTASVSASASSPERSAKEKKHKKDKKDKKDKKEKKEKRRRESEGGVPTPDAVPTNRRVTRSMRSGRNEEKEIGDRKKLEEEQVELRKRKVEEIRKRYGDASPDDDGLTKNERDLRQRAQERNLQNFSAYKSVSELPDDIKPAALHVDVRKEALFVPIAGTFYIFHVRTIKNIMRTEDGLRINFHIPQAVGGGQGTDIMPQQSPDALIPKEIHVKARNGTNLAAVVRGVKDVQKRIRQRETDAEQMKDVEEQPDIRPRKENRIALRDINIKPQVGAGNRSRAVGNLEAHENGFQFISSAGKTGKPVDIMYTNIKHAVHQPCSLKDQTVLLHFHLKTPLMIGQKKTYDVQFYTEARSAADDLNQRRGRGGYDPDEILEEQREREMVARLNKTFKKFVDNVENHIWQPKGIKLDFDAPYRELAFSGVPSRAFLVKSNVELNPCRDCLVALAEWPPFVLTITDVDIVYFERVTFGLNSFDMCFIFKDLNTPVHRVSTIPMASLDPIKQWLHEMEMVYYEGPTNMSWPNLVKEVLKDKQGFAEQGGWEAWFGDEEEGEAGDGEEGEEGEDDDDSDMDGDGAYNPSEDAESEYDDDDDEGSLASEEDDDGSDASLESDESEGLDWDAMSERMAEMDRKEAKKRKRDDDDDDDKKKKKKKKSK